MKFTPQGIEWCGIQYINTMDANTDKLKNSSRRKSFESYNRILAFSVMLTTVLFSMPFLLHAALPLHNIHITH